jgi:hypothetical protein
MKHRIYRRFKHAVPRRRYRAGIAAAGFLAAALTTGLLVTQSHVGQSTDGAAALAAANLARPNDQLPGHGGGGGLGPAPETSAPAQPSTAPAKPKEPVAVQAASKPPAKPSPPSARVLDYDYEAQINGYYCGPAATRIALTARDRHPSQDAVAGELGTTTSGTNSAEDTTRVLNGLADTDFYRTTEIPGNSASSAEMDRLQANVVHAVSSGYAVVANIVGSAADTDGASHEYDGGHYLTVVGYRDNGRTVRIADPAYVNGVSAYWMSTINLANWMGTRGYSA